MLDGNEPSNEEIRQHFALLPLGQRMCLTERQMVGVLLDRLASRAPTEAAVRRVLEETLFRDTRGVDPFDDEAWLVDVLLPLFERFVERLAAARTEEAPDAD